MLEQLFSLKSRVALITGGSRGIGKMIAKGFIEAGAKVYISSRDAKVCDATAKELGPNCVSLPQDLSTVDGARALAKKLAERESKLDILVNNAGIAYLAEFDEHSESGWDDVMNINLKSPFFLTQQLHSLLKAAASDAQPAKVINIASIDGSSLNPIETYSYHAAKAGLIFLTRRMAARLARDRIAVTAISPGPFATDMNWGARERPDYVSSINPMGRIGKDSDMAACAIYLASHAGDYVVGVTIPVDGGLTLAGFGRSIPKLT